jgi:DNA-binding GntR family transcriptional regulator
MPDPQSTRPAARAKPSYRLLADELRRNIDVGVYAEGRKMPTEAELQAHHGVSRHTVREALQQLLADGLIYRVQGSGTYVSGRREGPTRYLRSIGSLDEIVVWPDTRMEVIEPFHVIVEPSIAHRLELEYIEVSCAVVRRIFSNVPFVVTRHYVHPDLGRQLRAQGIPSRGPATVIGEAEALLQRRIAGARQDITAMNAPAEEAALIGCEEGDAILLIERLYYDTAGKFVEFTASHFNPRRYSYRMDLLRRSE